MFHDVLEYLKHCNICLLCIECQKQTKRGQNGYFPTIHNFLNPCKAPDRFETLFSYHIVHSTYQEEVSQRLEGTVIYYKSIYDSF